MYQRSVSLLVLLGLFASQMATIPHAHGFGTADQQREHDSKPHFHFAGWGHSHDHKHCQHGHSHSHSPKQRPKQSDKSSQVNLCDCEHDADAIFAPSAVTCVSQIAPTTVAIQFLAMLDTPQTPDDIVSGHVVPFSRPPPEAVLDASDTYLTLRNLRI